MGRSGWWARRCPAPWWEPRRRAAAAPGDAHDYTGRVLRVIDGNTIRVGIGGHPTTVQLAGVSAGGCFALPAQNALAHLLPRGQAVGLIGEGAQPRDARGRLVAYVYRVGHTASVNRVLLLTGQARLGGSPPRTFAASFAKAARTARVQGRGQWARCAGRPGAAGGPQPHAHPAPPVGARLPAQGLRDQGDARRPHAAGPDGLPGLGGHHPHRHGRLRHPGPPGAPVPSGARRSRGRSTSRCTSASRSCCSWRARRWSGPSTSAPAPAAARRSATSACTASSA